MLETQKHLDDDAARFAQAVRIIPLSGYWCSIQVRLICKGCKRRRIIIDEYIVGTMISMIKI